MILSGYSEENQWNSIIDGLKQGNENKTEMKKKTTSVAEIIRYEELM